MQFRTPIFAQAADLGLWFWFATAFFIIAAVLLVGGVLFLLSRSFFRFGAERVPLLWILGLAGLFAAFTWYFAGTWGLLAGAYVFASYLPGRWRTARSTK